MFGSLKNSESSMVGVAELGLFDIPSISQMSASGTEVILVFP